MLLKSASNSQLIENQQFLEARLNSILQIRWASDIPRDPNFEVSTANQTGLSQEIARFGAVLDDQVSATHTSLENVPHSAQEGQQVTFDILMRNKEGKPVEKPVSFDVNVKGPSNPPVYFLYPFSSSHIAISK